MKHFLRYAVLGILILLCWSLVTACSSLNEVDRPGGDKKLRFKQFFSAYKGTYQSDRKQLDKRLENVIDAIQEEDFDYLESLFSPKALAEAEDFAADLNYLFSFFEGKVLSYEFQAGLTDDGKNEGNVLTKDRYWYSVTTDKKEYLVFFFEYPRDQENPDNEGLYMLQVIEMKDKERLFDIGQDILVPGVYVPEG